MRPTAVPLAKATALLEEMAGIRLTAKRAERPAEADGAAARAAAEAESAAILARKVIPAVRMRYARFRDLGLFVGSGAVEGGCKNVIGTRLKQSGMRWSLRGADAMTHLPCQDASGTWDQIWPKIHNQTSAA
jgi:hypothetical protein